MDTGKYLIYKNIFLPIYSKAIVTNNFRCIYDYSSILVFQSNDYLYNGFI